jgi:hypothetical protein
VRVANSRGERGVVEALISRANQRWENVNGQADLTTDSIAETLHVLFPVDSALYKFGITFSELPASP